MLILDRRETEKDRNGNYIRPMGAALHSNLRKYDLEIATGIELEFGDAMFAGNGERGDCTVGFEHKRLSDLINSMKDRRLSGHQLGGLWRSYDYVFLFAEGTWRPGPGGEIEELKGKEWRPHFSRSDGRAVNYRQLAAYLHSLSLRSRSPQTGEPLRVVRTSEPRQTAAEYAALYLGFTEKRWDQHHAHDQVYTAITVPPRRAGIVPAKVTTCWRMAAQIEGIDRKAQAVSEYFETPRNMALAEVGEWRRVKGIGGEMAERAVRAMREREVGL